MIDTIDGGKLDYFASSLEALCEKSAWEFFDYSNPEDFSLLWNRETWKPQPESESEARSILIDWAEYPRRHDLFPRIIDFITPLDLVLSVFYDLVEKDVAANQLPLVIVIDRYAHRCKDSFSVELRSAVIGALGEFVQVLSVLENSRGGLFKLAELLKGNETQCGSEQPRLKKRPSPRIGQLRALRQAWIGYTSQSRDHHDLNNLLGPLVLGCDTVCEGGAETGRPLLESALLQASILLNLSPTAGTLHQGWAVQGKLRDLVEEQGIEVCLVDDQAERWTGFLANALSDGGISMRAYSRPHEVLDRIRGSLSLSTAERCLLSEGESHNLDQIIFLDLRLFPIGDLDERHFFRKLCTEILQTTFTPSWHHDSQFHTGTMSATDRSLVSQEDWPEAELTKSLEKTKSLFIQAALQILECQKVSWERIANAPLHDALLTLFARYVAQVLYLTPIVLFSSTGRRDLMEYMKGYENVITVFEKPRIPFHIDNLSSSFNEAINQATRGILARRKLRDLIELRSIAARTCSADKTKHYHVELFIDEHHPGNTSSSNRNIWVGGYYQVFEASDANSALEKAATFDEDLYEGGVAYYSRSPYAKAVNTKDKTTPCYRDLEKSLATSPAAPKWIGRARLRCKSTAGTDNKFSSGDDKYRRTLTALVESFLCESMPLLFDDIHSERVSFSVFAGTRVTVAKNGDWADVDRVNQAAHRWGFDLADNRDGSLRLESINRSALAPIVSDIHEYRNIEWGVHRAVAIRLLYDFDPHKKAPSFEPVGFLVCRHCNSIHKANISEDVGAAPIADADGEWARVAWLLKYRDSDEIKAAMLKLYDQEKEIRHEKAVGPGKKFVYLGRIKWGEHTLDVDQRVQVELGWHENRGYSADGLLKVEEASGPCRGILWESLECCPNCGAAQSLCPDYPCGVYIADQVVNQSINDTNAFGRVIGIGPLDFDDTLDEDLHRTIESGRLADAGNTVEAALRLAEAGVDMHDDTRSVDSLRSKIIFRLEPVLMGMTGEEFWLFSENLRLSDDKRSLNADWIQK